MARGCVCLPDGVLMETQRLLTSNAARPGPPEPALLPLPLGFCSGPFSELPALFLGTKQTGLSGESCLSPAQRGGGVETITPDNSAGEVETLKPSPDVHLNYLRNCLHSPARIRVLWTLGFQKTTNKATLAQAQAERAARLCEPETERGHPKRGDRVRPGERPGQLPFSRTLPGSRGGAGERKREKRKLLQPFVLGMATSIRKEPT